MITRSDTRAGAAVGGGLAAEAARWFAALAQSPALRFPRERYSAMMLAGALCLTVFDVLVYLVDPAAHWKLTEEDGFVENLTVVFWAVGGVYVLATLARRRARWLYVLLALGAIFAAGEEISWGQRLFYIATPDWLSAVNYQHELNLHNIGGSHMRGIALATILFGVIVVPVLQATSRRARALIDALGVPLVRLDVIATVVVGACLVCVSTLTDASVDLDEVGEMLLGLGFLLFALDRNNVAYRQ